MARQHFYQTTIHWTGNRGEGTLHYKSYGRDHKISVNEKAPIPASSDPAFMGDPSATTRKSYSWLLFRPAICCGTCIYVQMRV